MYLRLSGDPAGARSVLESATHMGLESDPLIAYALLLTDLYEGRYPEPLERLGSVPSEAYETQFYSVPKTLFRAQIYGLMKKPDLEPEQYESARMLLETKIREHPEDPRFHSSLGLAYAGLGQSDEAVRAGKLAVQLFPSVRRPIEGSIGSRIWRASTRWWAIMTPPAMRSTFVRTFPLCAGDKARMGFIGVIFDVARGVLSARGRTALSPLP